MTVRVPYYRLWTPCGPGPQTWDVDFMEVPADLAGATLEAYVRHQATTHYFWGSQTPAAVGLLVPFHPDAVPK